MWILYQVLLAAAMLAAAPVLLARRGRHYLATLRGRLGRDGSEAAGAARPAGVAGAQAPLWLHAVSVGEAGVAATLVKGLPAEVPLVVTTVTPTGQELARAALGGRARIAYLPFDLGFAVRRFFRRHEPRALVLVEGDYWPLVLRTARRRGMPVAVINGRVGDASFQRLERVSRIFGPLFGRGGGAGAAPGGADDGGASGDVRNRHPGGGGGGERGSDGGLFGGIARFGVQSPADRDRLLALGVPPERVTVTGNLKFESPEPPRRPELEAAVAALAGGRPVLLAGSTVAGEEEHVLAAFAAAGGGEAALLVLAPRHPERWDEVARKVEAAGLATLRRSRLGEPPDLSKVHSGTRSDQPAGSVTAASDALRGAASDRGEPSARPAVLLLDSLGELAGLYRVAAGAFVGGTLVPSGGHNPVEPARFGIPIVVGPSMENFRQIAEDFDRARAWERAADSAGLAATWRRWLADPASARAVDERAAALVEANRGALTRTLAMLREVMPEVLGAGEVAPEPAANRDLAGHRPAEELAAPAVDRRSDTAPAEPGRAGRPLGRRAPETRR